MRSGRVLAIACLASCLAAPLGAAGREDRVLAPLGPWAVDYSTERCSLLRRFGTAEAPVTLQIDSYGGLPWLRFLVVGKLLTRPTQPVARIHYRLGPKPEPWREATALHGTVDKVPGVSFSGGLAPYETPPRAAPTLPDQLKRVANPRQLAMDFIDQLSGIAIRTAGGRPIAFRTGRMAAPFKALQTCVDDLQRSWGLDPAKQKALTRLPMPKPNAVRQLQNAYPPSALFRGLSAYVPVRLMIDEAGAVRSCVVQVQNVDRTFSEAVCEGFARDFEPALDAAGQPVASLYQTSVVFMNLL